MKKILVLTAMSLRSMAQDCTSLVSDPDRVFDSFGTKSVTEAAQQLRNQGADVYARPFKNLHGFPTLDLMAEDLLSHCPSFKAPDGGHKNNIILVMIAVKEHKQGIYYGSQWAPWLDNRWMRIQSTYMSPRFRDGNYAAGFTMGLHEIQRLVSIPMPMTSSAPATIVQPTDMSGLWKVLGWIVGLCFAAVAVAFLWKRWSEYRTKRERWKTAKAMADVAKNQASSLVSSAETDLDIIKLRVGGSEDKAKQIKSLIDGAVQGYSDYGSTLNVPAKEITAEGFIRIAQEYDKISLQLHQAQAMMRGENPQPYTQSKMREINDNHRDFHKPRKYDVPDQEPVIRQTVVHEHYYDSGPTYIPIPIQPAPTIIVNNPAPEPSHSSWSTPDSSSSGGSSDFGSSSSDSGGSSDFGSSDSSSFGGDSGGGSSDW